jgi:signal transduction histidine kinase
MAIGEVASAARPGADDSSARGGRWRAPLSGSVKIKLLLAFAGCLAATTILNTGLTSYLTNRRGEAEAFSRLSQQLMLLQDTFQDAREALVGLAQEAARDEKNLSDMANLYSQELALNTQPDEVRDRALQLSKTVSLNRLQLILASARLSGLAVYLEGELSHYVTPDRVGLSARRGARRTMLSRTPQGAGGGAGAEPLASDTLANGRAAGWSEEPPPALVARRIAAVDRLTVQFDFPAAQLMVLRVVVPIQAATREAFNETIAEHLTVAAREPPRPTDAGSPAPRVIGLFVFSKAFDAAFLQDASSQTGVLPAVLSTDGRHRLGLVDLQAPPGFVSSRDDPRLHLHKAEIDGTSYYQAMKVWRTEGTPTLILGGALSRAGIQASVWQTLLVVIGVAGSILAIGVALGYVLISRMVTPIKALTAGAASMKLATGTGAGQNGKEALYGALGRYLETPVLPHSTDEIGDLTSAFNAMAGRLHDLIGDLRQSHRTLEAVSAQRQRAEEEVRALNATLEQQVRDRTSQLEAVNRELESFSYSVSHDLRAPLRGLDGFSRALLEDYDHVLDEEGRDYLRRIRAASQHMGCLIDDILNLARVSRTELRRAPIDLSSLAASVAEDLQRSDPSRNVTFVIAPNLRATGDPRLLRILLENLLHNACKFSSTRPAARIECGQSVHDGGTAYFVRDNGVGFDMAYAHKLFGAFQRLHTEAEFPGTGVGLATVQRIVNRHGGRVWAESQIGHGATFSFTLPDHTPGTP